VADEIQADYIGAYVLNGNLSTSWPMCLVTYVGFYQHTNATDCSKMASLMEFVAWSQLNPFVISQVETELSMAPLPFGFKTYDDPSIAHSMLVADVRLASTRTTGS
jgi:hypothetical protein